MENPGQFRVEINTMSSAYVRRVREADDLADRRASELDRVQEAERLTQQIEALAEPLRQAAVDEAARAFELLGAEMAWADAVAPLGLGPRTTIGELLQSCGVRRTLLDALARSEVAAQTLDGLAKHHSAWAERVAASACGAARDLVRH